MAIFSSVILLVFFLLELAALFSYGFWGFHLERGWIVKILFGIGTPLVVAVLWGMFVSPKATYPVSIPLKILIQSAVFLGAAIALYSSGQRNAAILFANVALLEVLLVYMMKL
jgi:hypothetical protein